MLVCCVKYGYGEDKDGKTNGAASQRNGKSLPR
jgi:hypothetical protein